MGGLCRVTFGGPAQVLDYLACPIRRDLWSNPSTFPAGCGKSPGSSLEVRAPNLPESECDCTGTWRTRQGLRWHRPARPKGRANCSGVTRDPGESISHAQAAGDDDRSLLIVTYLNPNPSLRRASTRRSRPLREAASRTRLAEWWDQLPRTFMPWLA